MQRSLFTVAKRGQALGARRFVHSGLKAFENQATQNMQHQKNEVQKWQKFFRAPGVNMAEAAPTYLKGNKDGVIIPAMIGSCMLVLVIYLANLPFVVLGRKTDE